MKRLKTWKKKLDNRFFKCHRSYIINLKYVRIIKRYGLLMQWGRNSCLQITERRIYQCYIAVHERMEILNAYLN